MVIVKSFYHAIRMTLSLSILLNVAHAQETPSNLNDQIKMLDRQFQDQITSANQTLADANSALNQCNSSFQADEGGKANPSLDAVPGKDEKNASILQAMLPALAPALPAVMDALGGAGKDAKKNSSAALADFNLAADTFEKNWALKLGKTTPDGKPNIEGLKNTIPRQGEADIKSITTTKTEIRRKANIVCDGINQRTSVPGSNITPNDYNACLNESSLLAETFDEMTKKLSLASNTNTAVSALGGAAISAAVAGFMASKAHDAQAKQATQQNDIAQRAADNGLAACKADAQGQINNAKRSLAQLQSDRADALRDLALRNAAERNKLNANNIALNSDGAPLPATNPGSPEGVSKPNKKTNEPAAEGGAAAGAGGAPGGGSGGGGTPDWGFGSGGNGNYLGGGLPAQEGGAQFAASGGGGSFSGGFASDSGAGLSLEGGSGAGSADAGRGIASVEGIGDGGLNVLMARMRLRFAYHAADLMQGVDLKSLAQKNENKSKGAKPTEASLPASQF